jgi:hypothetical protein
MSVRLRLIHGLLNLTTTVALKIPGSSMLKNALAFAAVRDIDDGIR